MQTDMHIPRLTDIIARAMDMRDSAVRLGDAALAERIDRLVRDKLPTARLCWQLGTLIIGSPSGNTYHATRAGCDCLNGRKCSKRQCWHLLTHELLLDMFATEAESADMQGDPPGDNPLGDDEGDSTPPDRPRHFGAQIVAARRVCWVGL